MSEVITNFLYAEATRLGPEMARRSLAKSPWNALTKRGVWSDESSSSPTHIMWERSLPASSPTWTTYSYNIGSSASLCTPSAVTIDSAWTTRQYNLEHTALESQSLCVENLRAPTMVADQLGALYKNLLDNTAWEWKNKFRSDFTSLCTHKIAIGSSDFSESASAMPVVYGGTLTNSLLETFHMRLNQDGADEESAVSRIDGLPVYALIIGHEASRKLLRESEYRTDIRENGAFVPELLKPLGARVNMLGFMHLVDLFPPRYDIVNGAWVERAPYTSSAATQGNKAEVSALYQNAAYEDAFIHGNVFKSLVPKPITSPGGNTSFNPQDYSGSWKWSNILDRTDNPDGTIGRFRGILSHAAKPEMPMNGMVIRFKRCATPTYTTCA